MQIEKLGYKIKGLRVSLGLIPTEFAQLIGGVSDELVKAWEDNETFPHEDHLERIAQLANVTTEEFTRCSSEKEIAAAINRLASYLNDIDAKANLVREQLEQLPQNTAKVTFEALAFELELLLQQNKAYTVELARLNNYITSIKV